MKQYSQEDINNIIPIDETIDTVVKKPEELEYPQDKPEPKKALTHDQLHDALMFAEDKFDRGQIPFVLLGDIADAVYQSYTPTFSGNEVHLGVMKRYLTKDTLGMFESAMYGEKYYIDDNIIRFEYKGVPIIVDIIHNDYPFFKYLEPKGYHLTTFNLPNPYDEYLRWKDQIK